MENQIVLMAAQLCWLFLCLRRLAKMMMQATRPLFGQGMVRTAAFFGGVLCRDGFCCSIRAQAGKEGQAQAIQGRKAFQSSA